MTADEIGVQLENLNLSEQCRRVAWLRFGGKLSLDKISEELGISKTRVAQHLAKARKRYPRLELLLEPNGRLAKRNIPAAA